MTVIDKLAWIHLRDKRVLGARSRGKDTFYIPGGKREPGETDAQALVREIDEELGVRLVAESLELAGVFEAQAHGHPEGVRVKMTCYFAHHEGELRAASEIEEIAWLSYAQKGQSAPVDHLVFDWLKERGLLA